MDNEVRRLKEELDCLRMKCEELNRCICCETDENMKLRAQLENNENHISKLNERIKYLEGQVDAYQYCLNRGKR